MSEAELDRQGSSGIGASISILGESVSELVGLAKPVVETGCNLINSLLGKPCRVAGELLADQVYAWQWHNRIRIMDRAARILRERQVTPEALPKGFLMPLVESSGWVEDEPLQELWAQLVANAVDDENVRRPVFVDVLKRMSAVEARMLARIWSARRFDALTPPPATGVLCEWIPASDDSLTSVHVLVAMGLVIVAGESHGEGRIAPIVRLTPFGWEFAMAVGVDGARTPYER